MLHTLTSPPNLKEVAFTKVEGLSLGSPLGAHVKWAFEHIYSIPYPGHQSTETKSIAHFIHGIQHVTRAREEDTN